MKTMVADALVGSTLDERYRIEERLASGGMASVYRATDLRLDRPVALKVMKAEFASDPEFVARFQQEARAAARLSHPNVVAVYDQGESDGSVYLAMEYVPGRTLRHVIHDEGRLSPSQSLTIISSVLMGLRAAHDAGFIHRDVKPENVLVPRNAPLKVTDFGLARALQGPSSATTGVLIGTAAYLAPEQVAHGHNDERSDVYQAGILLFELLTGRLPHTGENAWSVAYQHVNDDVPPLSDFRPDAPTEVVDLVAAATARDPRMRISSAAEFQTRVREIARTLPDPEPLIEPGPPPDDKDTTVIAVESDNAEQEPQPEPQPDSDGSNRLIDVREDTGKKPKTSRSPGRAKRVLNRLTLLALASAIIAGIAWLALTNPFNRADVPSIVGATEDSAHAQLRSTGFEPSVTDRHFSETVPAGAVISSDPAPAEGARVGSTVGLIVSMGPERYSVPKVAGLSPAQANAQIQEANLSVGDTAQKHHDSIPSGAVVRTKPKANASLKRDTPVTVIISKGPAPVDVPELEGYTQRSANRVLKKSGLKSLTLGEEFSDTIGEGRVIRTSPSPGIEIRRGDTVSLTISKGPPPVEVPNVIDMSRREARSRLEALGFSVRISEGVITPLDRVFAQEPGDGTSLPKGSQVTISVF